jgi:hypothetical protein
MKNKFQTHLFYQKDGFFIEFQLNTTNSKTGQMIQNYILPIEWIIEGKILDDDSKICFDCEFSKNSGDGKCYVRKFQSLGGLVSKVRKYHKLGIENIKGENISDIVKFCKNRSVRFGAYGEPVLLGENVIKSIVGVTRHWTGYTHQWLKYPWASKYFMASVSSDGLAKLANEKGFRTFYTGLPSDIKNYVNCPASKESNHKTICEQCLLCKGSSISSKNVYIKKH